MKKIYLYCSLSFAGLLTMTSVTNAYDYYPSDPYSMDDGVISLDNQLQSLCKDDIVHNSTFFGTYIAECKSIHNEYQDPYSSHGYALAKYHKFELIEATDIQVMLSYNDGGYISERNLYILDEQGEVVSQTYSYGQNINKALHLGAGTYWIETTSASSSSYSLTLQSMSFTSAECSQAIENNQTITDAWVEQCQSSHAIDYSDPYANNGAIRAKFYNFSLESDADLKIDLYSNTSTNLFILDSHSEYGDVIYQTSAKKILRFLSAGDYTLEITPRYQPGIGQFDVSLEVLGTNTECERNIEFNQTATDSWSSQCVSKFGGSDGYSDPYTPQNNRANYYSLNVEEETRVNFVTNSNDANFLLNIYYNNDVFYKANYWSSAKYLNFDLNLPAGNYQIEVLPASNEGIGEYELTLEPYINNGCMNNVEMYDSMNGYIDSACSSAYRGKDDDYSDPYAPHGNFYAKQHEFTLTDTKNIEIHASANNALYGYLSKKSDSGYELLTETYQNNWDWDRSIQVKRELLAGTYRFELTTKSNQTSTSYDLSLNLAYSELCYQVGQTDQSKYIYLDSQCKSEAKPTNYNYDPYGPSETGYYNARFITVKIEETGSYELMFEQSSFSPEVYIYEGADSHGNISSRLKNFSYGDSSKTIELDVGYYTFEITTQYSNTYGDTKFSLTQIDGHNFPSDPYSGGNTYPSDPYSDGNAYPSDPYSDDNTYPSDPYSDDNTYPSDPYSGGNTYPSDPYSGCNTYPSDPYSDGNAYPSDPYSDGNAYPSDPYSDDNTYPSDLYSDGNAYPSDPYSDDNTYPSDPYSDGNTYPSDSWWNTYPSDSYSGYY